MSEPQTPPYKPFDPEAWLQGLSPAEMGAIACGRTLLFPDAFRRMGADGKAILDQCLIRLPLPEDRDMATIAAISYVDQAFKRKRRNAPDIVTLEDAKKALGETAFDELENYAILAGCTYEPPRKDAPLVPGQLPAPFMTLDVMRPTYSAQTIADMLRRVELRNFAFNPGISEISPDDFWAIIEVIATRRAISPLGVMQGAMQFALLQRTAEELWSYRKASSSSSSMTTSTPES